ncbi:hypothetical protein [Comamonas sp. JC664]|uniref:hypothetical protein n=1 Tax=Comamonas sp. JC664 TaxID=2801917 RepID=UPI00361F8F9D
MGGGYEAANAKGGNANFDVRVSASAPGTPASCGGTQGWTVRVLNSFVGDGSLSCTAYALCAPVAPAVHDPSSRSLPTSPARQGLLLQGITTMRLPWRLEVAAALPASPAVA